MPGFLQQFYLRRIASCQPRGPAPAEPDPSDPKRQAAMRQAETARDRARQIIKTLQEQKLARQS